MKVVIIIATIIEGLSLLFKGFAIASLFNSREDEDCVMGVYSTYTIFFNIFIEVVLILSLCLLF